MNNFVISDVMNTIVNNNKIFKNDQMNFMMKNYRVFGRVQYAVGYNYFDSSKNKQTDCYDKSKTVQFVNHFFTLIPKNYLMTVLQYHLNIDKMDPKKQCEQFDQLGIAMVPTNLCIVNPKIIIMKDLVKKNK